MTLFTPVSPILGLWHALWRREVRTRCWWGNPKERDHLEGLGLNGGIILKSVYEKQDARAWTGLIWLRIGTSSRLLWSR